jgi:hypothetical protein
VSCPSYYYYYYYYYFYNYTTPPHWRVNASIIEDELEGNAFSVKFFRAVLPGVGSGRG